MKTKKDLLDLLKFTVNKKAKETIKARQNCKENGIDHYSFYTGLFMAYSEIYTLLNNSENY